MAFIKVNYQLQMDIINILSVLIKNSRQINLTAMGKFLENYSLVIFSDNFFSSSREIPFPKKAQRSSSLDLKLAFW